MHYLATEEVEFAGCLLVIGGPPMLMVYDKTKRLVSTTGYMFAAQHWYEQNVQTPPTTIGESWRFNNWWKNYKQWIWENGHA